MLPPERAAKLSVTKWRQLGRLDSCAFKTGPPPAGFSCADFAPLLVAVSVSCRLRAEKIHHCGTPPGNRRNRCRGAARDEHKSDIAIRPETAAREAPVPALSPRMTLHHRWAMPRRPKPWRRPSTPSRATTIFRHGNSLQRRPALRFFFSGQSHAHGSRCQAGRSARSPFPLPAAATRMRARDHHRRSWPRSLRRPTRYSPCPLR